MSAYGQKENGHKKVHKKFEDPEFEAEVHYAKENGLKPPTKLPSETSSDNNNHKPDDFVVDGTFPKNLKNAKAERKARSRGVSGSSIKKDGNRFEYGLDCLDLAYDNQHSGEESSDGEDYTEYNDYVCKYNQDKIKSVILDYFINGGNMDEAMDGIEPFTLTKDMAERTISDLIILSLEGDASWYELAAALLETMMLREWVTYQTVVGVLEDIVGRLDDLILDNPNAIETVAVIMAKLVDDQIVDNSTLTLIKHKFAKNQRSMKCLETCLALIGNRHLLNGHWTPSGGHQSLSVLSSELKSILIEYIQSNDIDAASNRIQQLKVPHFNHEMVYQASIMALEKMHDEKMLQMITLLKHMLVIGQLLPSCVEKGFNRLFDNLDDLYVDLPAAYSLARRWVNKCHEEKLISDEIYEKCPTRGRSRTLSRGPDGKLSVEDDDTSMTNGGDTYGIENLSCNGVAPSSVEIAANVVVH